MALALPRFTTLADYLDHYAAETPGADAVWHEGTLLSYAGLAGRVERMAGSLAAAGLTSGDRVAVLSTPRPEFLITLLAAFKLGAVWVGLNPRYTYRELAHVISESRPRLILSLTNVDGRELEPDIARLTKEFAIERAFRLDAGEPSGALGPLPDPQPFAPHLVDPLDPATIVFTSGSSGSPKGAVLSHRGLVYASCVESEAIGIEAPRVPCNLPVNHVACLADLTGTTLVAGGMLALLERFDPAEIVDRIEQLHLTNLMNVPTVLQAIAMSPDFSERDLSSLQVVSWGGAPLPLEAIHAYRARGIRLLTVYGMTETIASITFTDENADDEVLSQTVGKFDPGMRVRLADEEDRPVAVGEQGEVQVQHEGLFLEYFGRPDATAAAYAVDGWFKTGDVGVLREDGNLRLVGRRSEMIKSGGYNVYPREIELCIEQIEGVALAAVIGRPDDVFGEVGVAYVLPEAGAAPDPALLRANCREYLANYKVPKEFVIVDTLPLLPVGKVDKQQLKRRAVGAA